MPRYSTRLSETQIVNVSSKNQLDAFALWTFNPAVALRLLGGLGSVAARAPPRTSKPRRCSLPLGQKMWLSPAFRPSMMALK